MILPVIPAKNVTIIPAVAADVIDDVTEVDILSINDNTVNSVQAVINIKGIDKVYVLWDSTTVPTYDQIGNWTQDQANARILELI